MGLAPSSRWDVLVALAVALAILGLGQLWRHVLRSPEDGLVVFNLYQLIIWSPLFATLWSRGQPLSTVYLVRHGLTPSCSPASSWLVMDVAMDAF